MYFFDNMSFYSAHESDSNCPVRVEEIETKKEFEENKESETYENNSMNGKHSFNTHKGSAIYAICDVVDDEKRLKENHTLNRKLVLSLLSDQNVLSGNFLNDDKILDQEAFYVTRVTSRHISLFPNKSRWWHKGQVKYGYRITNLNEETVSKTFIPVFEPVEDKACPICLEDLICDLISLKGCLHIYHSSCFLDYAIKTKKPNVVCPLCNCISLTGKGPSPPGKMSWNVKKDLKLLSNGTFMTTIEIKYKMKSGTQLRWHPNPGRPYKGVFKKAFLPITTDYLFILRMLILAFLDGQTFRVEDSMEDNYGSVEWNGIEHKTNLEGGIEKGGFPDNSYKSRVIENILSKGVTM
ncbi:E3 ubiquitin-protein ligase DTX3L [Theileria parva strain Muguga]|uniref:RING-type E3 ubiquitin transferase n=1 Tax=Theileria parva TaxID=5875 RepID=Q4N4Y0_THEPA|nr:E3 ubiquitin-protein ligase DTX3L [Theileria parva strain Muguga]EAN32793.1 E3 ubiquitin-protein ligase DTX3L [Theileria parva strain Muguga]|eukprot:XP_765076.1 hypothetical protein [Theileria parva strain Muguga]